MTVSTPQSSLLVREVMLPLDAIPIVSDKTIFKVALEAMGSKHLGLVCIVDSNRKLLGIFTDGDVRRMLLSVQKPFSAFFADDALSHAVLSPLTCNQSDTLVSAVSLMGRKHIWDLPVVSGDGTLLGLLHLHPALECLLGLAQK